MEEHHDSDGESLESFSEPSLDPYDSEFGDYESGIQDEDRGVIEDHPKTLEYALEMSAKGSAAIAEKDFETAAECYSRVLEIRVSHYGELDEKCFGAYYYYGFALLRNALVDICPDESTTNSVSNNEENDESSDDEDTTSGFADETEYDTKDTPDNDEEESELDLAWKVLDIARVIVEKRPTQNMDNVNVLCALAEVNSYRDYLTTCLSNYQKAINILKNLDKPDLMFSAKIYYRMGLCLETSLITEPTLFYYQKALLCCYSKWSILTKELKRLDSASTDTVPDTASLIHAKKQEIGRVIVYSRMLKSKILEVEEAEKNPADLKGAVDAYSGKVKQLEMNVCSSSTSTDDEVIHLRKVGGFVWMLISDMYSGSNQVP